MTISIPLDAIATVPLDFTDQFGRVVTPPPGGSASIDNAAIATVTVAADDSAVVITPVADGTATLSYSNGTLSVTASVVVSAPAASSVSFGAPTFSAEPAT